MNLKSKTALAALSLIASSAVFAQAAAPAPTPDYTLAYNVGAVSDYRVRAITQTDNQASLQGGVDFTHKSGVYLGVWGANNLHWIKEFNGATDGAYEVDLYGGYKAEIMPGLSYDVGFITYQYPGNNSGDAVTPGAGQFSNASTKEFYGAMTYKIVTLKYNQSVGDFLGNLNSNGSRYWDLSANFDLGNGMTLTPHIGRQTIPNQNFGGSASVAAINDGTAANYTDYALTFAKDFGNGISATAAVVGTDAKDGGFYTQADGRFLAKSGFIAGVKYTF